jgi:hypothetical protein
VFLIVPQVRRHTLEKSAMTNGYLEANKAQLRELIQARKWNDLSTLVKD